MVAIAHDVKVCPFICVRNPLLGRIPSSSAMTHATVFGYLQGAWSSQVGVAIKFFRALRARSTIEPPLAIS